VLFQPRLSGQNTGDVLLESAATPSAANEIRMRIQDSGSGKTMLAKRLPGIQPPLDFPEALETTQAHSVAGMLAHNGVLFLDELPEFPRNVLELPRQPLEDGAVTLARSQLTRAFPARIKLAAAMNPCPCRQQLNNTKSCLAPGGRRRKRRWSSTLYDNASEEGNHGGTSASGISIQPKPRSLTRLTSHLSCARPLNSA